MSDTPIGDSEQPAHGQQVITVCAFIHHNFDGVEKVFLPQRAATKKFLPNVYELPGGHVDFGEALVPALQREIREEIGKEIIVGDPFGAFTYHNAVKGSHSIEVNYFAQFVGPIDDIVLHPEDHSQYGWYAEDELDTVLAPDDAELHTAHKAFALLRGESPQF